jgi:hypothetical protein
VHGLATGEGQARDPGAFTALHYPSREFVYTEVLTDERVSSWIPTTLATELATLRE